MNGSRLVADIPHFSSQFMIRRATGWLNIDDVHVHTAFISISEQANHEFILRLIIHSHALGN
jgi:hypothetical protein